MSNKVAIVTDSTAYPPEKYLKKYHITIGPDVIYDMFRSMIQQGYDVLGIFVSSKISGTFQSALHSARSS